MDAPRTAEPSPAGLGVLRSRHECRNLEGEIAKAEISPQTIIVHFRGPSRRRRLALAKMPYAFTFVALLRRQRVPLSAFDGFVIKD